MVRQAYHAFVGETTELFTIYLVVRPVDLDALFPDRARLSVPGVETRLANPIIVITREEGDETEDETEDEDQSGGMEMLEDVVAKSQDDSENNEIISAEQEIQEAEQITDDTTDIERNDDVEELNDIVKMVHEETNTEEVEEETNTDELEEETKSEEGKFKKDMEDKESEAEQKVQDLLVKLVTINGGWFDSDLRKKIKPIPKGWQLLTV